METGLLEKLKTIELLNGPHAAREDGMCAMEAVAWLAGEPHTDRPACACPVIASAVQVINDRIHDTAERTALLVPLLPRVVGTRAGAEIELKRTFIAADYAVRVLAPIGLRACGLTEIADRLATLSPIVDEKTADAYSAVPNATYTTVYTATRAADDAARAAAATAGAAVSYAASHASDDAARAAAAAAHCAVGATAWPRAIEMIEAMIEVRQ